MLNTNNIDIIEEITYIEVVEDNTTIEVIDEIIDIIEIGIQGPIGPQGSGLPEGGRTGDVLTKNSNFSQDASWIKNPINNLTDTLPDGNSGLFSGSDKTKLDNLNLPFEYYQPIASNTWVINHQLRKYPNVIVMDSAFSLVECNIKYLNLNAVELNFNVPFSGKAILQ